jgi:5-methylcytosine-specific restriction enzyme A
MMRQQQDQTRPSSSRRGYDRNWRKIREKFLANHPYCWCGQVATNVDHKVPKPAGTDDESNLQALCHSHHSAKTMRQSVRL